MNTIKLNPIDPTPFRTFVTESERQENLETTILLIAGAIVVGACIYVYIQEETKKNQKVRIIRRE